MAVLRARRSRSCGISTGFLLVALLPAFGQGFGHGTAVVVLRSPEQILAAVDSKEVYREYRDGKAVVDERTSCKLAAAGPYYAIVAGLSHGTNGFDALKETANSWREGDSLDETALRALNLVPRLLVPLLKDIRENDPADFAQRYRSQTVLQLTLLGRDDGSPRVLILEFVEKEAEDAIELSTRSRSCPGDCPNPTAAYFLGTHDRIDAAVTRDNSLIRRADESRVEKLINFEYADRPDLVGGPLSMVRIGKSGSTVLRAGACSFP